MRSRAIVFMYLLCVLHVSHRYVVLWSGQSCNVLLGIRTPVGAPVDLSHAKETGLEETFSRAIYFSVFVSLFSLSLSCLATLCLVPLAQAGTDKRS